ncbi:MAG: cytochrome P450 [Myxococcota bacterium]
MIQTAERLRGLGRRVTNLWAVRNDPLAFLRKERSRGRIVPLELGPFNVVAVFDASAIHHVLQHPNRFDKSARAQRVARTLLGNGLLTSEGTKWRSRRRIAQPAFRRPRLAVYATVMHEASLALAERWRRASGPIDLHQSMMHLALDIAARTLFDDDLAEDASEVDAALQSILENFRRMVTQPVARPEVFPVGPAVAYRKAITKLDAVVARLVERRRARGSDGEDLLHLWLHCGLDDEAVRDEVVTMLLAAHKTTANALTWAWVHLLRYPAALASGALPWTDAVISESMRRFPPVWATVRTATEPAMLQVDGEAPFEVSAGTTLLLAFHTMQHDPDFWPHPEGFDPGRWLRTPEVGGVQGQAFPELPFAPFGSGQHKCIGAHFAQLEARLVLATMVPKVDVELKMGQTIQTSPAATLRPDGPVWVVNRQGR